MNASLQTATQMSVSADMDEDMPCHSPEHTESDATHCEGVCLCMHGVVSQTSFIAAQYDFTFIVNTSERLAHLGTFYPSTSMAPPSPPPKLLS